MNAILNRLRYDTATATRLADDHFLDGSNRLSRGRGRSLYRTPKGRYFVYHETQWMSEHDWIEPLDPETAEALYEELWDKEVAFHEAFPELTVEEA